MKINRFFILGFIAIWFSGCISPVEDIREATYKSNIGLINADGTNVQYLTTGKEFVYYANFLPNGEKIVYALAGNTNQSLFTMNLDGSDKTPIYAPSDYPFTSGGGEIIPRIRFTKDSKTIFFAPISIPDQ